MHFCRYKYTYLFKPIEHSRELKILWKCLVKNQKLKSFDSSLRIIRKIVSLDIEYNNFSIFNNEKEFKLFLWFFPKISTKTIKCFFIIQTIFWIWNFLSRLLRIFQKIPRNSIDLLSTSLEFRCYPLSKPRKVYLLILDQRIQYLAIITIDDLVITLGTMRSRCRLVDSISLSLGEAWISW